MCSFYVYSALHINCVNVLGKSIVGTKKKNRIRHNLKIEQIQVHSTLHKECLNERACHCA